MCSFQIIKYEVVYSKSIVNYALLFITYQSMCIGLLYALLCKLRQTAKPQAIHWCFRVKYAIAVGQVM